MYLVDPKLSSNQEVLKLIKEKENINQFMSTVERVAENPNSIWFEDGFYGGGQSR